MQAKFYIKPLSTWEILERFGQACAEGCPERRIQNSGVSANMGGDSINIECLGKELPSHSTWIAFIEKFKRRPYLEPSRITLRMERSWCLSYDLEGNPPHPYVLLDIHDAHRDADAELVLADALAQRFTFVSPTMIAAQGLAETQLAGLRFAEQTIASFATEAARLSQSTTKNFEDFVAGVKTRTLELEEQFQKKSTELDETFRKREADLNATHADKLKNLEEREKAHAESVKQFELRNNTAVRRDLLKEIRTKIQEQATVKVSADTVRKRRIVHGVCIATLVVCLGLIGLFAAKVFTATTLDWKLFLPLGTWTAIFVTTGIYYIRWNDQWFREHARAEFENRKFSADILRASWVAELLFEWVEKKGVSMPPELVDSFTKNLFDSIALDGHLHPADQMSDLIKQFSVMEFGKTGVKLARKGAQAPAQ